MNLDVTCKKCQGYGLIRVKNTCECIEENGKEPVLQCLKCNNTGFILVLIECESCVGSGRLDDEWKKSLK